jgi:hypothetical protein
LHAPRHAPASATAISDVTTALPLLTFGPPPGLRAGSRSVPRGRMPRLQAFHIKRSYNAFITYAIRMPCPPASRERRAAMWQRAPAACRDPCDLS